MGGMGRLALIAEGEQASLPVGMRGSHPPWANPPAFGLRACPCHPVEKTRSRTLGALITTPKLS